jgi:DNA processing protein
MGLDAPGCLWAKGDLSLLQMPMVSLVGSRELYEKNRRFAEEAGRQAALQGYVLVSGNAKGADREAQEACLEAGGRVISVVADELETKPRTSRVLWLSEDGYDLPFTTLRALSRNHVIHSLGSLTLVAQCTMGKGGTWDGTVKNLHNGYSPVCCFDDGSDVVTELVQRGAMPITMEQLGDFAVLQKKRQNLFEI